MNEVAGMYSSKHCADSIFFGARPNDGFVVTEDNFVSREGRRVQEGMKRLESNRCLQRSKHRNMALMRKDQFKNSAQRTSEQGHQKRPQASRLQRRGASQTPHHVDQGGHEQGL